MALKYIGLSKHPSQMNPDELQAELGHLDDSKLMRSLIIAEIEYIRQRLKELI